MGTQPRKSHASAFGSVRPHCPLSTKAQVLTPRWGCLVVQRVPIGRVSVPAGVCTGRGAVRHIGWAAGAASGAGGPRAGGRCFLVALVLSHRECWPLFEAEAGQETWARLFSACWGIASSFFLHLFLWRPFHCPSIPHFQAGHQYKIAVPCLLPFTD